MTLMLLKYELHELMHSARYPLSRFSSGALADGHSMKNFLFRQKDKKTKRQKTKDKLKNKKRGEWIQ